MADQTISCSGDSFLDESSGTGDTIRGAVDHLNFGVISGDDVNPVWTFDVSSLAGKAWDSVTLTLTHFSISADPTGSGTKYLSHLEKAMVASTCTWNDFDTAMAWSTAGAETSADSHSATRVAWVMVAATNAVDDTETSPDITAIVTRALNTNSGTLHLILYTTGANAVQQYDSVETVNGTQGFLTFTNVRVRETTTVIGDDPAINVAVPSAVTTSKSGRPPIAGADRQVSATVIHDGVEPMKILAITLKGAFGADN